MVSWLVQGSRQKGDLCRPKGKLWPYALPLISKVLHSKCPFFGKTMGLVAEFQSAIFEFMIFPKLAELTR